MTSLSESSLWKTKIVKIRQSLHGRPFRDRFFDCLEYYDGNGSIDQESGVGGSFPVFLVMLCFFLVFGQSRERWFSKKRPIELTCWTSKQWFTKRSTYQMDDVVNWSFIDVVIWLAWNRHPSSYFTWPHTNSTNDKRREDFFFFF